MEYLSTDKLQETWNERKNILFFLISLGSSVWLAQARLMTLDFSFLVELSHQGRSKGLWGAPHGRETQAWGDFLGEPFRDGKQVGVEWERGFGMAGMESWSHGRSSELSWAWAQSHPAELRAPALLPRLLESHPIPLCSCQWWHVSLWSEIIISGPLFSHLLLHQVLLCFLTACHRTLCPCWQQIPRSISISQPKPSGQIHTGSFFFFFQKSPVFYGLAPKRKQHTSQEQEGMKLFQIPGPQTVLMPPKSLIAAHHSPLPLLCHSRSSPAAGITSIIGFFTVRMPHRNDIIPSLSTWSHSFPMLALANISSSSTTTYKPPMWFVLSLWGMERNCLGIAFKLQQDPFLGVSRSS